MNSSRFSPISRLLPLATLLAFLACGRAPGAEDLAYLPGYWEIEQVVFPDGEVKEYPQGTTLDYYELNGREGYLKKLQVEANGRFLATDDALPMKIEFRQDRFVLHFEGEADSWEEELLELGPNRLVTRHSNGLQYEYRRYEPLKIMEE